MELTSEQKVAADHLLSKWKGMKSLSGAAGTGKTTLLASLATTLESQFDHVLWTAMTGRAAFRMSVLINRPATTFHKQFFWGPDDGGSFTRVRPPPSGALLVIDESSMMPPDLFDKLKAEWVSNGVSVLFVGDSFQLPPVMTPKERGVKGEDWSIFSVVKGPSLSKVMRSGDDILHVATILREERKVLREDHGAYKYIRQPIYATALGRYFDGHPTQAWIDSSRPALITWRNKVRMTTNRKIRVKLGMTKGIPEPGESVMFCRNGQSVLNGEIVIAESMKPGPKLGPVATWWLEIRGPARPRILVRAEGKESPMDGSEMFLEDRADWDRFRAERRRQGVPDPLPITWGYCLTAHKAQGGEYNEVLVFLAVDDTINPAFKKKSALPDGTEAPFWTRWIYTALTRARQSVGLCIGPEL